ncbi:MAG: hypothetical protein LBT66_00445 [Methanobrevibacter sp.]|nr:hypothetical protein [Candidatus Methanovirga meridionalis]
MFGTLTAAISSLYTQRIENKTKDDLNEKLDYIIKEMNKNKENIEEK